MTKRNRFYLPSLIDGEQLDHMIRSLNDAFRITLSGGELQCSPGILNLELQQQFFILDRIRNYQNFTDSNDPDRQHRQGSFSEDGLQIVWEIHCFDNDLWKDSPDPANADLTRRYLTVSFVGETDLPDFPRSV